ncbi:MAG TPA: tetratricopeptide repeat protein [Bryobacteraceae bacterium]|jgi:tetratricopeptide (TPR) repeat protein
MSSRTKNRLALTVLASLCLLAPGRRDLKAQGQAQVQAQAPQQPSPPAPSAAPAKRDLKLEDPAQSPASVAIPRSYAVVVGIAKYEDAKVRPLEFSDRDAESIYSILISPEGGNFHAENVHKLIGPKATLANIKQELEVWLPSVAKDNDRVLVYFAGHGFIAGGKAYLAPYDLKLSNISSTAYPMDTLGSVFANKINAKYKVLLTDSCHSGAISVDDAQAMQGALQDLGKSLFSLTASRDREVSYESSDWGGGHGIFTYYVVKGLEGSADANRDGIVTADELADYVRTNVRAATNNQQTPTSERGSFDPNMLLAYVPSNRRPDAPPPPKFGTLIFETNMDGVEVFVDGKSAGVVNKSAPLKLPGMVPGTHVVQGVHLGYEPDGPRDETVYPGQDSTITIKILIQRRRTKAALDHLDRGVEYYTKGGAANYRKAEEELLQALAADPKFSQAALYLGRTYNALFDEKQAETYLRKAVEIDPDYLEAHASLAGVLLDTGDLDEALRQLNVVRLRDSRNPMMWYLLSQVYCRKASYPEAIDAAKKAIQLTPNNAEAHFWLAESLRMSTKWDDARREFSEYLRLSNFDSGAAGRFNYYVMGYLIGFGKKRQASQIDIWRDLRSSAYFGMCNCETKLGSYDSAISDCQKALGYDSEDPMAHYALGLAYMFKAKQTGAMEVVTAARDQFSTMVRLNPDLAEAEIARKNIATLDGVLRSPH